MLKRLIAILALGLAAASANAGVLNIDTGMSGTVSWKKNCGCIDTFLFAGNSVIINPLAVDGTIDFRTDDLNDNGHGVDLILQLDGVTVTPTSVSADFRHYVWDNIALTAGGSGHEFKMFVTGVENSGKTDGTMSNITLNVVTEGPTTPTDVDVPEPASLALLGAGLLGLAGLRRRKQ